MNPDSLNMLLFLKANRKLWFNPSIIQRILNKREVAEFNEDDKDDAEDEDEIDEDSEVEF